MMLVTDIAVATVAAIAHIIASLDIPIIIGGVKQGDGIATSVSNWIRPLVYLAIGIIALKFLMQRQMTQFFQFIGLAVLVFLLFQFGNVILEPLANFVKGLFFN